MALRWSPFLGCIVLLAALSGCGQGGGGENPDDPGDHNAGGGDTGGGDTDGGDTGGGGTGGGDTGGGDTGGGDTGGGDTGGGDTGGGDTGGGDTGGGDTGGGDTGGGDTGGGDTGGGDTGGGDTGGGGSDPEPPVASLNIATIEERAFFEGEFAAGFANTRDNAQNGGVSLVANLPGPGTSDYSGFMEILFFSSPAANVKGQATLSVDLQTGATDGNVTGFMGSVLDETMTNQIVNYEGDVTLSGGSLTTLGGGAAGLNMSIDGNLDNGLQSFGVSGELDGYFFGPGGEGMVVSGRKNALNDDITATVDGAEVDGTVTMWTLQD